MGRLVNRIRTLSTPLSPITTDATPRLSGLPGIRAVLFDVYGTLLISGSGEVGTAAASDRAHAAEAALAEAGMETDGGAFDGDAVVATFRARIEAAHAARRADGVTFPEIEVREVWQHTLEAIGATKAARDVALVEHLAVAYECRVNPTWPMPGAIDIPATLRARGLRLGIVSNSQFYTPLLFEAFFDASPQVLGFEPEFSCWSYAIREGKPSTSLYETALSGLRQTGIEPTETLYVGNDMLNDVWAAGQAGCRTALFAGDRRSLRLRENDARCATLQPDAVVTELTQLPDLL